MKLLETVQCAKTCRKLSEQSMNELGFDETRELKYNFRIIFGSDSSGAKNGGRLACQERHRQWQKQTREGTPHCTS